MYSSTQTQADSWLHVRIIQELTSSVVTNIGALYKASEAVALLDVLWSFAHASIGIFLIVLSLSYPNLTFYDRSP